MSRYLSFPVDRFRCSDEYSSAFRSLHTHGYAVIPCILTPEECSVFIAAVWTWLESLGLGITRDNVNSWAPKNWISMIHGIIKGYGIGQQEFMWNLRQHTNVVKVFQTLWNVTDVVCSFDGMSLHRPKELVRSLHSVTKRADVNKPTNWMHLDHTPDNPHESVQSFVSLYENTSEDGCLLVYDGSHLLFSEFFSTRQGKQNWYKYTPEDHAWLQARGCPLVRVAAPQGSMVLWNSKTVHSSAFAMEDRVKPVMRMVLYVCMVPRWCVDLKTQQRRRKMVIDGRTSSHSPIFTKVNPVVPRHPMLKGAKAKEARIVQMGHLRKRAWKEISNSNKALI